MTEFKHLTGQEHPKTALVYEYPRAEGDPYYPVPRPENQQMYRKYQALAAQTPDVHFLGRLGTYSTTTWISAWRRRSRTTGRSCQSQSGPRDDSVRGGGPTHGRGVDACLIRTVQSGDGTVFPSMPRDSDSPGRFPLFIASSCGLYVLIGGVLSLAGWAYDRPRLTDLTNVGVSIQPNAAVAALLTGAAVLLLARTARRSLRRSARVGLIGATTLVEHLTHADFGIDGLLLFGRTWGQSGTTYVGRMGVPASVSWSLLAAALLLNRSAAHRRLAPFGAVLVASIAGLSLTGFAYDADPLYAFRD